MCASEVRPILLTRHVLRLYYRIDGSEIGPNASRVLPTKFIQLLPSSIVRFAAFNVLILTGTNNFARTWSTDIKHKMRPKRECERRCKENLLCPMHGFIHFSSGNLRSTLKTISYNYMQARYKRNIPKSIQLIIQHSVESEREMQTDSKDCGAITAAINRTPPTRNLFNLSALFAMQERLLRDYYEIYRCWSFETLVRNGEKEEKLGVHFIPNNPTAFHFNFFLPASICADRIFMFFIISARLFMKPPLSWEERKAHYDWESKN